MSDTISLAESTAKLLDMRTVADIFGCSPRHIYRITDAGRIPAPVKLGALVRWPRAAIEEWIAAGCPACRQRAIVDAQRERSWLPAEDVSSAQ